MEGVPPGILVVEQPHGSRCKQGSVRTSQGPGAGAAPCMAKKLVRAHCELRASATREQSGSWPRLEIQRATGEGQLEPGCHLCPLDMSRVEQWH